MLLNKNYSIFNGSLRPVVGAVTTFFSILFSVLVPILYVVDKKAVDKEYVTNAGIFLKLFNVFIYFMCFCLLFGLGMLFHDFKGNKMKTFTALFTTTHFFKPTAQMLLGTKKKKQSRFRSIISDIFDGSVLSLVQCLTCDRVRALMCFH